MADAARVASSSQATTTAGSTQKERLDNQILHLLYVREEFDACVELIDKHFENNVVSEYPLYLKALIERQRGNIHDSLLLFQEATALNPGNPENLKQVGRSFFLLGKHKAALDVYEEAQQISPDDWEIWHHKGLSFTYLKQYNDAIACFRRANECQPHDTTFIQLGKVHVLMENLEAAIQVYHEALELSPENTEILTAIGLLYLRVGDTRQAFDFLGSSLSYDPRSSRSILAAGSIIQEANDMDVALNKYRVPAVLEPNCAELWNNVGMCFFGKGRFVAAIACLKKALYLDPFAYIISYNLGVVHLATRQYASAFHFLSSSINLRPDVPAAYHYLAVTLARLDDLGNACAAYERAIEMGAEPTAQLNYAITLLQSGDEARARAQFDEFREKFKQLGVEQQNADPDVLTQVKLLSQRFGVK